MLPRTDENYRGLTYPWGRLGAPEPETPVAIADGVWWARFPMPGGLDHINIWLLEDEDGWTVVDTCLKRSGSRYFKVLWATSRLGASFARTYTPIILGSQAGYVSSSTARCG